MKKIFSIYQRTLPINPTGARPGRAQQPGQAGRGCQFESLTTLAPCCARDGRAPQRCVGSFVLTVLSTLVFCSTARAQIDITTYTTPGNTPPIWVSLSGDRKSVV